MARRWQLVRARREALPSSVRRFAARARQRRINTAKPWLVAAGVLAVLALLAWGVYGSPLLSVSEVEVVGARILSKEQVRGAARVPLGTPLARIDTDGIGKRVGTLAPVARVDVSRSWPSTVVVTVTERQGTAVVQQPSAFAVLDHEGVLFQITPARPEGLPLLKLANPARADPSTKAALRVLAALTPELKAQLDVLEAESVTRIQLGLKGGRKVIWGDAESNEKKATAATVLLGKPGKTIDVSAPDFPVTR
ncbi:cell division protein FtsQ/DivIB [Longispora albida]|uniref:cell division protein FtsQ/DivIB n=1 Tax=Longispora albida TaxID=203523 RepID=UPI0003790799|nr:FtsQ-type POTRA domain-containing protein [Longispora albida]